MRGIKIDNYTAKEAMERVIEYMKLESVQTIEMITLDTLKCYEKGIEWDEDVFDITFAESREVLEKVGVKDETLLKEAESYLFLKMFARFLHKNYVKVFLLAENQEVLADLKFFIQKTCAKVEIVETATWEEHGVSDDMILNRINGVEAECILAALPSPMQQEFIAKNRMLINARIWVGFGNRLGRKKKSKFDLRHILRYFLK